MKIKYLKGIFKEFEEKSNLSVAANLNKKVKRKYEFKRKGLFNLPRMAGINDDFLRLYYICPIDGSDSLAFKFNDISEDMKITISIRTEHLFFYKEFELTVFKNQMNCYNKYLETNRFSLHHMIDFFDLE